MRKKINIMKKQATNRRISKNISVPSSNIFNFPRLKLLKTLIHPIQIRDSSSENPEDK